MKEDAQLICPISFDDSAAQVWPLIEGDITASLPLRDVVWKSNLSSNLINVPRLPLRFLPSSASLFKDTDHPFRWFLAPYVNLYLISVESLEAYRHVKPKIKAWVDNYNGVKRESWLLVYVPRGASTSTYDTYQKVYARLCADFYSEKPADRCVMIINKKFSCSKGVNNNASNNGPLGFGLLAGGSSSTSASTAAAAQAVSLALQHQSKNCYSELMTKLKDGVVASFEHRCLLYDTEVRKGEAYRNSLMGGGLGGAGVMINANTLFDFKQLYLIKESLSLMYQMLTLYNEALVQLRELEVLLSYVPAHLLMDSQYPLLNSTVVGNNENGSVSSSSSARSSANASRLPGLAGSLPPNQSNQPPSSQSQYSKWRESWTDASKYGEEVMLYSINSVRMRVLKNKIGLLELQRYVYARIVYFLTLLGKPALVAEKGLQFLSFMRNTIDKKLAQEDDVTANQHQHQQLLLQQQQQQQFDSGSSRASHSSFQSPNPIQLAGSYDHASFSPAPSSTMHSSSPPTSYPSLGSGSTSSTAASVSIYPSRRALADVWVVTAAMKVVQYVMVQFNEEVLRVEEIHREGVVAVEDRPVMPSLHETCKNIVALLYYALSRLQYILVPEWNLKSLKSDSGSRAQAPSVLTSIWQIVMDMTALYTDWNSLSAVKSMYPFPFAPLKSDRERKCHRFINASASATTTISGVEESINTYPQKLRHMLRATLYAMSSGGDNPSGLIPFSLTERIPSLVPGAGVPNAVVSKEQRTILSRPSAEVLNMTINPALRGLVTAQQCQIDALLFILCYISIFSLLSSRPRFGVLAMVKCIDIQILLGNFNNAKAMLVKLLFPHSKTCIDSDRVKADGEGAGDCESDGDVAAGNHLKAPSSTPGSSETLECERKPTISVRSNTRMDENMMNWLLKHCSSVSLTYIPINATGHGGRINQNPMVTPKHGVSTPAAVLTGASSDHLENVDLSELYSSLKVWVPLRFWVLRKLLFVCRVLITSAEMALTAAKASSDDNTTPLSYQTSNSVPKVTPEDIEDLTTLYMEACLQLLSLLLIHSPEELEGEYAQESSQQMLAFREATFRDLLHLSGGSETTGSVETDMEKIHECHVFESDFEPFFDVSIPTSQWHSSPTEFDFESKSESGLNSNGGNSKISYEKRLLMDDKHSICKVVYDIESENNANAEGGSSGCCKEENSFDLHINSNFPCALTVDDAYIVFESFCIPKHGEGFNRLDDIDLMGLGAGDIHSFSGVTSSNTHANSNSAQWNTSTNCNTTSNVYGNTDPMAFRQSRTMNSDYFREADGSRSPPQSRSSRSDEDLCLTQDDDATALQGFDNNQNGHNGVNFHHRSSSSGASKDKVMSDAFAAVTAVGVNIPSKYGRTVSDGLESTTGVSLYELLPPYPPTDASLDSVGTPKLPDSYPETLIKSPRRISNKLTTPLKEEVDEESIWKDVYASKENSARKSNMCCPTTPAINGRQTSDASENITAMFTCNYDYVNDSKHNADVWNKGSFKCRPFSALDNSNKLSIIPGPQVVKFKFQPDTVGEFVPTCVVMRIGKRLVFVKHIVPDVSNLGEYLREIPIFSVIPPKELLKIKLDTPLYTPVNCKDECGFYLSTAAENETIDGLSFYVYTEKCDTAPQPTSYSEPLLDSESICVSEDECDFYVPNVVDTTSPFDGLQSPVSGGIGERRSEVGEGTPRSETGAPILDSLQLSVSPCSLWVMEMTRMCTTSNNSNSNDIEKSHSLCATVGDMVCTSNQLIFDRNAQDIRDRNVSSSDVDAKFPPPVPASSTSTVAMQMRSNNSDEINRNHSYIYYKYCNNGNGYAVSHLPVHTSLYVRVPFTIPCTHQRYAYATRSRLKINYLVKGTLIKKHMGVDGTLRKSVIPFVMHKARYIYTGSSLDVWCRSNELAQGIADGTSNGSYKDNVTVSNPNGSVLGNGPVVQCNYMCTELDYKLSNFPLSDTRLTKFDAVKEHIANSAYWDALKSKAPEYTPGASMVYRIEQVVNYHCIVRNLSPITLILTDYELLTASMSEEPHNGHSEKQIVQQHTSPASSNASIVLCATTHSIIDGPLEDIDLCSNEKVQLAPGEEYSALFMIQIVTLVVVNTPVGKGNDRSAGIDAHHFGDMESMKSNRWSGMRLTESHSHYDSETVALARKKSSKSMNSFEFVDLEKIVGLVFVYEREDRQLDLHAFEHMSHTGVLSFHSDVCFYMDTYAAFALCSELLESPRRNHVVDVATHKSPQKGIELACFPQHCILHYIQHLLHRHMKLAITGVFRHDAEMECIDTNVGARTKMGTDGIFGSQCQYQFVFKTNDCVDINYKLVMDAHSQSLLLSAIHAYYQRMGLIPNKSYHRNMDRLCELFHIHISSALATTGKMEFTAVGKTTMSIPLYYNSACAHAHVPKNGYADEEMMHVPMLEGFSRVIAHPDIRLTYACNVAGVHAIPPIKVSLRLPGLRTTLPLLVQQDLISISEPLLYDGKQLHPQFIVSNENAKYQYLPIANTNCGAIDSTMLFIKPYDVTQSVLRSEKSLV